MPRAQKKASWEADQQHLHIWALALAVMMPLCCKLEVDRNVLGRRLFVTEYPSWRVATLLMRTHGEPTAGIEWGHTLATSGRACANKNSAAVVHTYDMININVTSDETRNTQRRRAPYTQPHMHCVGEIPINTIDLTDTLCCAGNAPEHAHKCQKQKEQGDFASIVSTITTINLTEPPGGSAGKCGATKTPLALAFSSLWSAFSHSAARRCTRCLARKDTMYSLFSERQSLLSPGRPASVVRERFVNGCRSATPACW